MKEWDQVWNQREVLYRVKLWLWLCGVEGMKQQMDSVVLKEQQVPVVKTAAGGCSAKPSECVETTGRRCFCCFVTFVVVIFPKYLFGTAGLPYPVILTGHFIQSSTVPPRNPCHGIEGAAACFSTLDSSPVTTFLPCVPISLTLFHVLVPV